ncbi:DUF4041 domain-containing protein [Klebsiella variicola]|uniref:DUF4041 domain-containing protein n=2 Tax=Klebsiella/Raoultella group TaxID=2890311 RepID=UPI000C7DB211|nr:MULTISPECIES: DUF4041 domain-containing protein [Klebsiella]EIW9272229.1 DUF4041 domain-containing protein [Klebsiella variicola]EIY5099945.1 DUF4041 domain-containing protein [Klebsiella variicola]EKZ6631145.1 DUF4041 domain-containing protein [Klebsiella variicola]MBM4735063.1 DUF4041 domain-containing protein [Klebsiella variicola]MBM7148569.1 DUF4041 domain-containing protein [Klebsiella variicola]
MNQDELFTAGAIALVVIVCLWLAMNKAKKELKQFKESFAEHRRHDAEIAQRLTETEAELAEYTSTYETVAGYLAKEKESAERQARVAKQGAEADILKAQLEVQKYDEKVKAGRTLLLNLRAEYEREKKEAESFKETLELYASEAGTIEQGFYEPQFSFPTSERFMQSIRDNREEQKELHNNNNAVWCSTEWTVSGSKREGKKFSNRIIKLTLRAFNGECDAAISGCSYRNVNTMKKRIQKAYETLNKMNEVNQVLIGKKFLELKLQELALVYEYHEKRYQEREEQRELRAQMLEEERAQKELDKAVKEAEAEEKRYKAALEKAREELAQAQEGQRTEWQNKVNELEEALALAEQEGQRAISMAQQTRAGHVYIISNIGSFGETVFKIGMTRRLNPQDRVDELGGASVPFRFDVHAMIKSDDAPSLETALHQRFTDARVNKVNHRKEFFNVSLDEIKQAVYDLCGDKADFIETALAKDYFETKAIEANNRVKAA